MKETPIQHSSHVAGMYCKCGALLMKNISIKEGRCTACRNIDAVKLGVRR